MVCCLVSCNGKRKSSPPCGRGNPGKREGWGRLGVRGNCGLPASLGKTLKESGKTKHPPVHNSSVEIPRRISAGSCNVARCDRLRPASPPGKRRAPEGPSPTGGTRIISLCGATLAKEHALSTLRVCAPEEICALSRPCACCAPAQKTPALSHSAVLRSPRNMRYPAPCVLRPHGERMRYLLSLCLRPQRKCFIPPWCV